MADETNAPSPLPETGAETPTEPTAPVTEPVEPKPVEPVQQEAKPQDSTPPPESPADPESKPDERVVPAADGYKLPEGIPPELGKFANEHDFTQEQLDATIKQFSQVIQGQEQARQNALRALGEKHLKDWGEEADYRLNLARRALKQNDPEGTLAKALNESGYGNHPAVLDFLAGLGKSMQEGGYLKSAVHRPPTAKTAAQAMYPDLPSKQH